MSAGNGRMDVEGLFSNRFCTSLERGDPGGDYPGAVCVPGGGQENDADQHCVGGIFERGAPGAVIRGNFYRCV